MVSERDGEWCVVDDSWGGGFKSGFSERKSGVVQNHPRGNLRFFVRATVPRLHPPTPEPHPLLSSPPGQKHGM